MADWPNGKALAYEARDCRFDPCVGHFDAFFFVFFSPDPLWTAEGLENLNPLALYFSLGNSIFFCWVSGHFRVRDSLTVRRFLREKFVEVMHCTTCFKLMTNKEIII